MILELRAIIEYQGSIQTTYIDETYNHLLTLRLTFLYKLYLYRLLYFFVFIFTVA